MSVTCLGADPSTRIEPGGHINPVDPNLAPSLGPQGVFRAHLWSAALTHPENGHFHVENGAMGGINGTCDAWCGSRSHKHIRVDCYELLCTILGALWLVTALKSTQKREARKRKLKVFSKSFRLATELLEWVLGSVGSYFAKAFCVTPSLVPWNIKA